MNLTVHFGDVVVTCVTGTTVLVTVVATPVSVRCTVPDSVCGNLQWYGTLYNVPRDKLTLSLFNLSARGPVGTTLPVSPVWFLG